MNTSLGLADFRFFALDALDTWFFREPRPFHADESAAGEIDTAFPPPCRTVVGALRAAMARSAGWSGRGSWDEATIDILGDGSQLHGLRFCGPVVSVDGQALWPAPATLTVAGVDEAARPLELQAPGEPLLCDLGTVRLATLGGPAEPLVRHRPAHGLWLTTPGLESVLAGEVPEAGELRPMASVATWESRVGIARDPTTRTAKEHALFAARHVRPHDDLELLVGIAGVPNAWTQPLDQAVIPFGGEGRQARIRNASAPALPRMPEGDWPDPQQYTVTFLTPAFLPAEAWVPGAQVAGLPGKVVAACCAEPIRIGGWDSEARQPLPARSAVPAGSTWFFEQAAEHVDRKRLAALHGSQLANAEGDDSWGFGFMAIGRWATTHERMTP